MRLENGENENIENSCAINLAYIFQKSQEVFFLVDSDRLELWVQGGGRLSGEWAVGDSARELPRNKVGAYLCEHPAWLRAMKWRGHKQILRVSVAVEFLAQGRKCNQYAFSSSRKKKH